MMGTTHIRTSESLPFQESNNPEVDVSNHPQNNDSVKKISVTNQFTGAAVATCLGPDLTVIKGFYFLFYAALGSLFPFLSVYFKQLGLNGAQAGVLIGIRPLIEYIAAPLWVSLAERRNRLKIFLLTSLCFWILFTFPLGFIHAEPVACIHKVNSTAAVIMSADPVQVQFYDRKRRDISNDNMILLDSICHHVSKRDLPNAKMNPGITPNKVHHAMNYDPSRHAAWVSSSLSSQIFKKQDVNIVFYLLLVFVLVGAALSSPATVISDSVVLRYLGGEGGKRYAHQRILGLCGWGIAAFVMGLVLDYVPFPWRKCEPLL
ncbi:major facilitator superfamily domain-containing protein 6 isoform X1 [Folsomia candida]|uniref:major facilitator superfamily domain-containing protein 6 isoform X1 n=1 Tax=Folsomia candida TaxID=158441 RepID=UPI0016055E71|nr:major facilitator superfamily domain-containing protein 6 isoform X1 [Folsomia candida]